MFNMIVSKGVLYMRTNTYQAEVITMKSLKNLFIEMTAKNCNMHCKYCYIDFPKYKKVEDYIKLDIIKNAINETNEENIECIYLTGAEPMTHPEFNAILRFCLTRSNVCICTNGSFINEKKARFLKKVEDESEYVIWFKISLDHYEEVKNDSIRYRGAYRHSLFALKHLVKYGFTPVVTVVNYYNLSDDEIYREYLKVFAKYNLNLKPANIQIVPYYDKNQNSETIHCSNIPDKLDCIHGRTLTSSWIYTCPFLANDYRGRCGSSFSDYNKRSSLETNFCNTCLNSSNAIFAIDFTKLM